MISLTGFEPGRVDISGQPKPIVGLPEGALKCRVRFRRNSLPVIYIRFVDRIQKHILLISGQNLEPFERADGVNILGTTSCAAAYH